VSGIMRNAAARAERLQSVWPAPFEAAV
jgi:hypothetical protein